MSGPPTMSGPPSGMSADVGPPTAYGPPVFNIAELVAFRRSWIVACWTTCVLAVIIVALRLFARAKKRGSAGWDDWTIVIAVILSVGDAISNTFQHYCAPMTPCFAQASISSEEINSLSLGFMRLSVCIFVLRLLPPNAKLSKYATWFAIFLNFVATVVCLGVFGAANPYSHQRVNVNLDWNPMLNKAFTAAGALTIVTDFITVFTPIFVIHALQMNLKTKLCACAILCLGTITACLSVGKLVATSRMAEDMPHNVVRIQLFADLEQNLGIIFASCPALRQFYGYAEKRIRSSKAASGGSGSGSGKSGASGSKPTPLASGASEGKRGGKSVERSVDTTTTTSSMDADRDLEKGGFTHTVDTVGKRTSIEVQESAMSDHDRKIGARDESRTRGWDDIRAPSMVGGVDAELNRGREREGDRVKIGGLSVGNDSAKGGFRYETVRQERSTSSSDGSRVS